MHTIKAHVGVAEHTIKCIENTARPGLVLPLTLVESKEYVMKIILGEETAKEMEDEFVILELDKIAVKGKTEGVNIYTSLGTHENLINIMNYDMAQRQHEKFLFFYRKQAWQLALRWLNDLEFEFNGMMRDYYDMMGDRIEQLQKEDLPEDWDGVYRATTK